MRFDQQSFQLVFNVVTITAVTSLTVICRLLRRDNQRLAVELSQRPKRKALAPRIPAAGFVDQAVALSVPASTPAAPKPAARSAAAPQDIRQFVAKRSRRWLDIQQGAGQGAGQRVPAAASAR